MPTALPFRVVGDLTFSGITVEAAEAAEPLFIHVVAALTNTSVTNYSDGRPRSPTVTFMTAAEAALRAGGTDAAPTRRFLRRRLQEAQVVVEFLVEVASEQEGDEAAALIQAADQDAINEAVTGAPSDLKTEVPTLTFVGVEAASEPDPPLQRAERAVAPEPEVVDEGGRDKLGGSSAGLIFVICFVLVLLSVGLYFLWPKICHEDEEETREEANGEELKLKHALQDADDEILEAGESHALHAKLEKKPVTKKPPKTVKTRVPPGTQPGTTLEATLSDGRKAQIAVPLDAKAGDALTVEVPEPEEVEPEPPLPCLVTPEPPPPDVDHLAVKVPAGAQPGSVVEVVHADGRTVTARVPDNTKPGETLFVPVDKKAPPPQIAEKGEAAEQAAEVDKMLDEGQDEDVEHRELTVPAGAKGGDRVQVAHPDGGAMDVVLPHDATPGETLLVPVPAAAAPPPAPAPAPSTLAALDEDDAAVNEALLAAKAQARPSSPTPALQVDATVPASPPRPAQPKKRTPPPSPSVAERAAALKANSAYPGGAALPPSPYPDTKKAAEPKGAPEEKSTAPPGGAPESKSVAPAAASSKAAPVAKAAPPKAKATPKPKPKAVSALKQGVKGASSPALQERLSKLKAAGTPAPAAKAPAAKTSLQTKLAAMGARWRRSGGTWRDV